MTDPGTPEKKPDNILKIPEGMSPAGMIFDMSDMTEAYVKSVMTIPEKLDDLVDEISGLIDVLSIITLYCEKKGLADGVLAPDDIERPDDGPEKSD
jgi:hypothetical protein